MYSNNFKKSLSLILSLTLVFGIFALSPCNEIITIFKAYAEERESGIAIEKTYLKVGDTLNIYNPNDYDLCYFVGDEEVTGEEFILKEDYCEKWITVKSYNGSEFVGEDSAYFGKMPVIYINTEDGNEITSKEEYKQANMIIQNNTECEDFVYSGTIKIKGRGNSTWKWPKKPYRIKLGEKTNLFGMGKNKNWVLLANYLDESLLRNTTASQISENLGLTTMQTVWTDVVINGEYVGNYQLCEQIRIDKDRVDIFDWEEEAEDIASAVYKAEKKAGNTLDKDALEDCLKSDLSWVTTDKFTFKRVKYNIADYYDASADISGGYLFELSKEYDEPSKFMTDSGLKVMLKSPEFLSTNSEMTDYVKTLWNDFEKAFCSEDGYVKTEDGMKHYTELADIDSMISYWLTLEIMGNNDAATKSRYVYKDVGDVMKFGPVWDFDWGCGSLTVGNAPLGWKISKADGPQAFFKEFLDDPLFICKATEKYWEIRPFLENIIKDGGILDEEIKYLSESGKADNARWDRHETWPKKARGFETDAQIFKNYLTRRIAWLDMQFSSDIALNKSTYYKSSAFPYTKSDDEISVKMLNTFDYNESENHYATANGIIKSGKDVIVSVKVNDSETSSLNVYVNGLFYENFVITDGTVDFEVLSDKLTFEIGKKNVISFIGKNAEDETTYKNFVTVVKEDGCKEIVPEIKIENVIFDGGICADAYVDLDLLTKAEISSGYVEFTFGNETKKVYFDENNMDSENRLCKFSCAANLTEMTDTITAVYKSDLNENSVSATYQLCDINSDGVLDILDIVISRAYITGAEELDEDRILRGDINGDKTLDIVDIAIMRRMVVNSPVNE